MLEGGKWGCRDKFSPDLASDGGGGESACRERGPAELPFWRSKKKSQEWFRVSGADRIGLRGERTPAFRRGGGEFV